MAKVEAVDVRLTKGKHTVPMKLPPEFSSPRYYLDQLQLLGEIHTSMPVIGHAVAAAYTQIRFRLAQRQTLHL